MSADSDRPNSSVPSSAPADETPLTDLGFDRQTQPAQALDEEAPRPALPSEPDRETLWDPLPNETTAVRQGDSAGPKNLGPLGLIGFGPRPESPPTGVTKSQSRSVLVTIAAIVIILAALRVARPVLLPLVVSAFVATLTAPLVLYLRKRRVPEVLAVPSVVILTLGAVALIAGLVVGSLNAFVQALPQYQADLIEIVVSTAGQLDALGFKIAPSDLLGFIQPGAVVSFLGQAISGIADFFSSTLLILLLTVFVLFEALVLPAKIRRALGDPNADLSQGIRIIQRIKAYVVVKTGTSLVTGLFIWLILGLMGVDFAFLWGMLAFLLNYIPNIGSIIAAIPATLLSLLQLGWTGAITVALVFLAVNTVIGSFVEPRIMGRRMNLSPLIVFFSLLFWGWLWGPLGMLLSVPLTMVVRIFLEGNPETRPLAVLMAGAAEERPASMGPLSSRAPPAKHQDN